LQNSSPIKRQLQHGVIKQLYKDEKEMPMYVISFCNQKGGTGKTSVTSNTAAFLSNFEKDKRILLIDLDAQGHTTYLMYKDPDELNEEETISMLFQDKEYKDKGIIHQTRFKNVEIVPSNFLLTGAKVRIGELKDRLWRVWRYLKLFNRFYDYVLIDTPPDLDIFLLNALYASDYTIIPTDLETLAIRGINDLLNTIENVQSKKRDRVGEDLRIMGVLPNKLNKRYKTHKNVMEKLKEKFGSGLLEDQQIGTNATLVRAYEHRQTIFEYSKTARSYKQYKTLTQWIIQRLNAQ